MKLLHRFYQSFRDALYDTIITHDGIEHAGYLAFLGLLALFPFLVFLVAIAGFLGEGEAGTQFISLLMNNLPPKAVAALEPRIVEIVSGPPQGLLTISILGSIWTASSAVEGIRTIVNRAYHVGTPPAYWWRRLMSILQLLIFTGIVVVAMFMLVFAPLAMAKIEHFLGFTISPETDAWWHNIIMGFTGLMMFLVVANIYYILPNIRQTIMAVVPGAIVVVLGWIGTASLFSLYLSNFDQVNLIYGSLGGIIATLIFFYIANIVFIFGAEFNYHFVVSGGQIVEEKEHVEEDLLDSDNN